MSFIERLTELRKERGLTQKEVLEACGLNKNSFGLWKDGRVPIASTQKLLADYFGVSVSYLMGKTDTREEPTTNKGDGLSQEFTSLYCQLTPEQREIVLAAMREFAKEK